MLRSPLIIVLSILLIAFGLTTAISIDAVETALTNRLKNADREVAYSIAINLSREDVTRQYAQTLVDAHFALGSYQRIRLLDSQGQAVYVRERHHPPAETGLEDNRLFWLWTLKPREQLAPATAPVRGSADGIAHVSVQSVLSFDHRSSEQWLIRLALIFSALGAVAGSILLMQQRRRNQHLKALEAALQRLAQSDPPILADPDEPTFAGPYRAFNNLIDQSRQKTRRALEQVEQLNRLRRTDVATGLLNREAFAGQIHTVATEMPAGQTGYILLLRLLNLPALNQRIGRNAVDAQLAQLGRSIAQLEVADDPIPAARISGTDIALLVRDATRLQALRESLPASSKLGPVEVRVDEIRFAANEDPYDVLRRCELNLPDPSLSSQDSGDQQRVWHDRLNWALTQHHFFLQGFRMVKADGTCIHREFFLRLPDEKAGVVHMGGVIVAWAEHLNLAAEIDFEVINLALSAAADQAGSQGRVCINVTEACLLDQQRRESLIRDLAQSPRLCSRLDIEIAEKTAFQHRELVRKLAESLRELGIQLGVDHLDAHAGNLMQLRGCSIAYVKVSGSLTSDMLDPLKGREQSRLLGELIHSAHDLSMQIYAEGIASPALMKVLFEIGFDGVTGPAVGS